MLQNLASAFDFLKGGRGLRGQIWLPNPDPPWARFGRTDLASESGSPFAPSWRSMLASTRPAASPFRPPLIRFFGTVVGGTVGTDDAFVSFW